MKKITQIISASVISAVTSNAAVIVTTTQTAGVANSGIAGPTPSSADLAQTQFSSSSATGANNIGTNQGFIFNGTTGTTSSGTGANGTTQVPTASSANTITLNLNTSVNVLGYDITGIDTYMGWNPTGNGRSNQGYSITLGFVGGGSATLVNAQHWEPNNPAQYWTTVSFTNSGGGALNSDTVNLNGAGAVADANAVATGVNSITWDITNDARANGVVVLREFDVFGTATVVPEPSSTVLLGLGGLALILRRRK